MPAVPAPPRAAQPSPSRPQWCSGTAQEPVGSVVFPAQSLLPQDFLQRLKSYDKDNIQPRIIQELKAKYVSNEGFTAENAKKASPAAEGMCK